MISIVYVYLIISGLVLSIYGTIFFVLLSILHPKFLILNDILRKIPISFFLPKSTLSILSESIATYFQHTYKYECSSKTYLSQPNIKCLSPHGVIPYSIFCIFNMPGFIDHEKNTLTVAHQLFAFPILAQFARDVLKAIPNYYDQMNAVIGEKRSLLVYLGGIREMMATDHRKEMLYVRRRKGIFQMALQRGVSLLPIYTFGMSEVYTRSRTSLRIPDFFGNEEESMAWVWGKYGTFFPYRKRLFTVVGTPLSVEKREHPTSAEIETLKERYIEAVRALYLRWREKYDSSWKERELVVL